MSKSRDAFRTISEVSDTLDTPAHVLRFWESKFSQVKPVKRAGGRRYYRPGDVDLLAGIKKLLHEDGMTIKGAQKLLRAQGVKNVAALGASVLAGAKPAEPVDVTPVEAAEIAPETKATAPDMAALPDTVPDVEVDITNVVPLGAPEPTAGPALTMDLADKPAQTTGTSSTAPGPDVRPDPADNDSKAAARVFHLLHAADPAKLAARAHDIAPLLDRMQVLHDRVAQR